MAADGLSSLERSPSQSPLPRRLGTYLLERFPPVDYAAAASCFFLAAYLAAIALVGRRADATATVVGIVTVVLVFFHLRLMDEVKDAAHDARHYPDRPVPRGLVTLSEIRALAGVAVAAELLVNAALSPKALAAYVAVLAFTLLMYREFFLGQWLHERFLIYTLAHIPSLPLLAVYAYVLAVMGAGPVEVAPAFVLFLVESYAAGLSLEIARKIHAPADEPADVYTYSKDLGVARVGALLVALVATETACALGLGLALDFGVSFALLLVASAAPAGIAAVRFAAAPSRRSARLLEKVFIPVAAIGPYLIIVVHVLTTRPLA